MGQQVALPSEKGVCSLSICVFSLDHALCPEPTLPPQAGVGGSLPSFVLISGARVLPGYLPPLCLLPWHSVHMILCFSFSEPLNTGCVSHLHPCRPAPDLVRSRHPLNICQMTEITKAQTTVEEPEPGGDSSALLVPHCVEPVRHL